MPRWCADISSAATQSYVVSSADSGDAGDRPRPGGERRGATTAVATPIRVRPQRGGGGGGANSVPVTSLVRHAGSPVDQQRAILPSAVLPHPRQRDHRPLQGDARGHQQGRRRRTRRCRRHPVQLGPGVAGDADGCRWLGHVPHSDDRNAVHWRRGPRHAGTARAPGTRSQQRPRWDLDPSQAEFRSRSLPASPSSSSARDRVSAVTCAPGPCNFFTRAMPVHVLS